MNPEANGQMQREWGWWIAIYLFLGGIGGGAYTIGAVNWLIGEGAEASTAIGLWIGFPALAIGSVCLLVDLGSPTKAILAGLRPGTSWMARGFWIISVFMVLAFLHFGLHLFTDSATTEGGRSLLNILSVAGILFAVATMAYTGILLSASKGIPFWRSGAVPVVFVVSALVTGHFTLMLGMTLFVLTPALLEPLHVMALEAAVLVGLEVLAIVFFLQAAFSRPDPRESAQRILRRRSFVVVKELYEQASSIRARFEMGGWILGGFIGLVIGLKLIGLSVWRQRGDYEADRAGCLACGRCYKYCPREHVRLKKAKEVAGKW